MSWRNALNIADLQRIARRRLPRGVYGFVAGGVEDDHALRNNRAVFERVRFKLRALVDVSQRNQSVELFGHRYDTAFGIAPMGITGICRFGADAMLARTAARLNMPYCLSNMSTMPMEAVSRSADSPKWCQGYLCNDRPLIERFVKRVADAGFEALVVTTDVPVVPNRENNARTGFTLPFRLGPRVAIDGLLHPRWMATVLAPTLQAGGVPRLENVVEGDSPTILATRRSLVTRRDSMDWSTIDLIRGLWRKPLLIKGVLHPDDVGLAVRHGLDGVILSNHGGRQLDSSVSPLEILGEAKRQAQGRVKLIVDSGFRRGTDILKAYALGADLVMCGRAALFGIAAGAEAGAEHAMNLLKAEVLTDLGLVGAPTIGALDASFVDARDLHQRPAEYGT